MTFRFAVVHSLPSAIRLEEAIVPDRFWSFAGSSVEQPAATHPNAMLSAIATTLLRLGVMSSSPAWSIALVYFRTLTLPQRREPTTHELTVNAAAAFERSPVHRLPSRAEG